MSVDNLIDGRAIAEQIHSDTTGRLQTLKSRGIEPCLVFVRVGEDPASQVYVEMKARMCKRLGIRSGTHVLAEKASEHELLALLQNLNANRSVHGILVQAPIPKQIDSTRVYSTVSPEKDVDGFHPKNMGKLLLGDVTGFVPCTPAGIHELLVRAGGQIEGANVVVLGRGNIVGKPMAALLMQKNRNANATVTVCHSQSRNVAEHCRRADIIIAAMGVAQFVQPDMVKHGATVIDVGVNRIADPTSKTGSRLVGDVAFETVRPIAGKITPNPGGVGPMTIAMLMRNTITAAERSTYF
ncbi:MAG TPA: bifunctional 5,10-methylenetetrahydrofolate dehydrogenase/5,10-methenyltetrahydrofolate cyclohydrolase [Verrucomicrobiae bacterium]|nr:bifunctional 5,10-methylenetetrahydrofolate dehydrogenase/5,10-methenyltetrahydrofolate cyclohydrolase [Verrucomicrobiae bacterium]